MRKILLAILLICSNVALAYIPTIVLREGWKDIPIVVTDNRDYFYSHEVCPPEMVILPRPCGKVSETMIIHHENLLPPEQLELAPAVKSVEIFPE